MKNLKALGLCTCITIALLGTGCGSADEPKNYLVEKQNCAKYIPSLEKEIEKSNEAASDNFPNRSILSSLVKVCYSSDKNTCLKGQNVSIVGSDKKVHFIRSINDILTNQVLLVESIDVPVSGTDSLIQETEAFRNETLVKMDAFGCVD